MSHLAKTCFADVRLDPGSNLWSVLANNSSSAFKKVSTLVSCDDSPISPILQILPAKGPKPPAISIPYSDRSDFLIDASSTVSGIIGAVKGGA